MAGGGVLINPIVTIKDCIVSCNLDDLVPIVKDSLMELGLESKIAAASRVFIKVNMMSFLHTIREDRFRLYQGRPVASTDPMLVEALVVVLKELNPVAEISVGEAVDVLPEEDPEQIWEKSGYQSVKLHQSIKLVDINQAEFISVECPDMLGMHKSYLINKDIMESDFKISIGKLKLHGTASLTMSIKNMFGCIPNRYYGHFDRGFLHSNPIRLLRTVIDVARITMPDLSIIDGIVTCDGNFVGEPVEAGVIIMGTKPASTDAIGAVVMGVNPENQFPNPPFLSSENYLHIASGFGMGPISLKDILLKGAQLESVKQHFTLRRKRPYPPQEICRWVWDASTSAVYYQHNQPAFWRQYHGKWIYLVDNKVLWVASSIIETVEKVRACHRQNIWGFDTLVCEPEEQNEILARYREVLMHQSPYRIWLEY